MGGKSGGGGGGIDANDARWLMENAPATQMAQQYFGETAPARTNLINRGNQFLAGDLDPTQTPMYGTGKRAIEDAYGTARQNLISNMPTGGGLTESMANLENRRAEGLAGLSSSITQDEYNKIYGLATGAPQTSLGGVGGVSSAGVSGASNIAAADLASQAQSSAGKSNMFGQFGQGAGMYLGSK